MGPAALLDRYRRSAYLQPLTTSRLLRLSLRSMLAASIGVGAVLLWSFTGACGCGRCQGTRTDTDLARHRGDGSTAAVHEFPGSAPDLGDPRIGARMEGNNLAVPPPDRLVVAARHKEDILWMHEELSNLPYLVYQDDDPSAPLQVQRGPGTEAKAYLQFILDNYDRLPDVTVFIHAHRESWHFDDMAARLHRLQWAAKPFANLRFDGMAGGLPGVHLNPREPARAWDDGCRNTSSAFQALWHEILAEYIDLDMPAEVFAPCCGQFMVVRERITARPRALYAHILQWLQETKMPPYWTGRAVEYAWHIIFGEAPKMQAYAEIDLYYPAQARDTSRRMLVSRSAAA